MSDQLLAELNEEQRAVVKATHGPVLVLAGAGSGKTRALTYRIAYLLSQKIAAPSEIFAVTFTNKAAGELNERVEKLLAGRLAPPAAIGTFHSLGARMLRERVSLLPRSRAFVIFDMDDSERVVRLVMDEMHIARKEFSTKQMRHRISEIKNNRWTSEQIIARWPKDGEMTAAVHARYEQLLAKNDAFDFDDLLLRPVALLEANEDVRQLYKERWRWLSVDEYQDTNPLQDKLLQLLVGTERNICVVGDDYQAIYSWRGAKVDHILNFEKRWPGVTTIYLTRNYRSTANILEAANKVIAENKQQKHKQLWTEQTEGEQARVVVLPSSKREAMWLREEIEEYVSEGGRRADVVALYRTNAQSRALEEEFLTYGIPYTIVGGFRFYERREIKDALAFLQLWVNGSSVVALHRIADALWRGVGPKTLARWEQEADQEKQTLFGVLTGRGEVTTVRPVVDAFAEAREKHFGGVGDLLQYLLQHSGYLDWLKKLPDGEERLENIEELLNVTAAYEDVEQFLEEVALLSDIDRYEEEQDRVTCMTLHAAKGLEFPVVYIIGCEEGLLPHQNSVDSAADLEEERRLLYVGMTRAKERLTLSHARTRMHHGDITLQAPSRFLKALPESVTWLETAPAPVEATSLDADMTAFVHQIDDGEPVAVSVEEGDYVRHEQFGRGVVIEVRGSVATCVFEGHGVKSLDETMLQTAVES